jgi:hypothetical protein
MPLDINWMSRVEAKGNKDIEVDLRVISLDKVARAAKQKRFSHGIFTGKDFGMRRRGDFRIG